MAPECFLKTIAMGDKSIDLFSGKTRLDTYRCYVMGCRITAGAMRRFLETNNPATISSQVPASCFARLLGKGWLK